MKFIKDFFFLNFNQYENFGLYFPVGALLSLLCIASSFAIIFVTFYKKKTGLLCRRLLRYDAIGEDRAMTLGELKIANSFLLKGALLRGGGQLTYTVKRAGQVKLSYEEYIKESKKKAKNGNEQDKTSFETERFYIDPERTDIAKKIVENSEISWIGSTVVAILFIAFWIVSAKFLPNLLELINASV